MVEEIYKDNEGTSLGAVRVIGVPYDSLEDSTPTPFYPVALLSSISGVQLCGTVLSLDESREIANIDFTHSMVYNHYVRNVLTYNMGAEATWGEIEIGDPVFCDRSTTMPPGAKLSTSPLDAVGNANPLFGFRVGVPPHTDLDPKGADGIASTNRMFIMQVVSGGFYTS